MANENAFSKVLTIQNVKRNTTISKMIGKSRRCGGENG